LKAASERLRVPSATFDALLFRKFTTLQMAYTPINLASLTQVYLVIIDPFWVIQAVPSTKNDKLSLTCSGRLSPLETNATKSYPQSYAIVVNPSVSSDSSRVWRVWECSADSFPVGLVIHLWHHSKRPYPFF